RAVRRREPVRHHVRDPERVGYRRVRATIRTRPRILLRHFTKALSGTMQNHSRARADMRHDRKTHPKSGNLIGQILPTIAGLCASIWSAPAFADVANLLLARNLS